MPAAASRLSAELGIAPVGARVGLDALQHRHALVGRPLAGLDQPLDVAQQRIRLRVARVVEREDQGRDRRDVDGVDAVDHHRSRGGDVARTRHAAPEAARDIERTVVAGGQHRDAAAHPDHLLGDVLEGVAVDVGRGQDHLRDLDVGGCRILEVAQHRQQELVAHAVGDDAHRGGSGLPRNDLEELAQIGLRRARALTVVGVVLAAERALRGPAVEERRTVELDVVGDLRGPEERMLEAGIEAVDEDQRVVLVALGRD